MPLNKEPSRRSMEIEFEVPGTPEQVWQAIATGPGIGAWFVPTEVEEREGGAIAFHLGGGMDSSGTVTGWEPPHRFAYEEPNWSGEAPPLGTEFIIEAQAGGTCTVRLVHSLFTSREDWDDQIGSMETGWPPFFRVLRLYLAHFAGLPAASVRPMARFPGTQDEAWDRLRQGLGLADAKIGERFETSGFGAPALAGTVEGIGQQKANREMTLRIERPFPGAALIGTFVWDGQTQMAVSLYFYGEGAEAVAARETPAWQDWLDSLSKAGPA